MQLSEGYGIKIHFFSYDAIKRGMGKRDSPTPYLLQRRLRPVPGTTTAGKEVRLTGNDATTTKTEIRKDMKLTHGSLFSGIGGFDLAAEWMGWENKFHCEWNDFGKRVLKYYWPNAESFTDITKTDFTPYANTIDILAGGFPCQPYSTAGKRKGKEDERHLWPEMLRAIREVAPRWVVGENVFGLVNWNGGMVFDEVQTDLEAQGYVVQPYVLPACGINAPHRRDRVWFVAYANGRADRRTPRQDAGKGGEEWLQEWDAIRESFIPDEIFGDAANPYGSSTRPSREGNRPDRERCGNHDESCERGEQAEQCIGRRDVLYHEVHVSDTYNQGLGGRQKTGNTGGGRQECDQQPERCHQRTDWHNFPTQPPICNGNDGLPAGLDGITFPKWRNESIKAGGNAIVPQVAYEIFKAIQQYEKLNPYV